MSAEQNRTHARGVPTQPAGRVSAGSDDSPTRRVPARRAPQGVGSNPPNGWLNRLGGGPVPVPEPRRSPGSASPPVALCFTAEAAVVETVQACAAAIERSVMVVDTADRARRWWDEVPVVFVGVDRAAEVLGAGLATRAGVHLCARDPADAVPWSVPLQATVLGLERGSGQVTELMLDALQRTGRARLLRVLGASGGVGASTLAAGLGLVAVASGSRTAVVELAQQSGGLDLLLGVENESGWRWPELVRAQGRLGDVRAQLPQARGVTVVSGGRESARPAAGAVRAVLDSLRRTHDLVIVDAGRGEAGDWQGSRSLLVVAADVRSVMAARHHLAETGTRPELVVRRRARGGVPAQEVSAVLGLPVLGELSEDRSVPQALELADQPGRRRGRFRRQCERLLQRLDQGSR